MGKIYAQPRVLYDWEDYFDEDEAIDMGMWFGGNRQLIDINADLFADTEKEIQNFASDLDSANSMEDEDDIQDEIDILFDSYYFKTKSGRKLKNSEKNRLIELVEEYLTSSVLKEKDIMAEILSITAEEEYVSGTIRGSSQGDWLEYLCPKKYEDKIPYIESVLFGTGTEYAVTEEDYGEEPNMFDIETYQIYLNCSTDSEIKKEIAKSSGCSPSDIVLLK